MLTLILCKRQSTDWKKSINSCMLRVWKAIFYFMNFAPTLRYDFNLLPNHFMSGKRPEWHPLDYFVNKEWILCASNSLIDTVWIKMKLCTLHIESKMLPIRKIKSYESHDIDTITYNRLFSVPLLHRWYSVNFIFVFLKRNWRNGH